MPISRGMPRRRPRIRNKPLKEKDHVVRFVDEARADLETIEAPCPHFGTCGGCDFQDLSYTNQEVLKKRVFEKVVAHFEAEGLITLQPEWIASPKPW